MESMLDPFSDFDLSLRQNPLSLLKNPVGAAFMAVILILFAPFAVVFLLLQSARDSAKKRRREEASHAVLEEQRARRHRRRQEREAKESTARNLHKRVRGTTKDPLPPLS